MVKSGWGCPPHDQALLPILPAIVPRLVLGQPAPLFLSDLQSNGDEERARH